MHTQFSDDPDSQSLFQFASDNRNVFATGMFTYLVDSESLGEEHRQFIAKLAKKVLGDWPVAFVDYDTVLAQSSGRFSGYRVIARCCAFNPSDPDTIEYALVVFHQQSAQVELTNAASAALATLDWGAFAEAVPY